MPAPRLAQQIDIWQGDGRYTFTREDIAQALGRWTTSTRDTLRRLQQEHRLVRPRTGFYAIVPPEYRRVGTPPPTWYIDQLMQYLEQPYYVGLLSAAATYGAAHHQPQELQVVTDRPTRVLQTGPARVRFIMNRHVVEVPIQTVNTPTGTMRVATPAATAFDLVIYLRHVGGIGNVASVLRTLAPRIDAGELGRLAKRHTPAAVRRLGYLLEAAGATRHADLLASYRVPGAGRAVLPLHPGAGSGEDAGGSVLIDDRWGIRVNTDPTPEEDA